MEDFWQKMFGNTHVYKVVLGFFPVCNKEET